MSNGPPRTPKKVPVVPLVAGGLVLAVLAFLVFRKLDYRALEAQGLALIRGAGPWAFFGAAALLPAVGAPLTAFTITSAELFAPTLTLPGVIAAMLAAIAVNLALTYWLARYALRPVIARIIARYGYSIPTATKSTALSVTLALRLTPGPPFFLQSYLLGMAEVPFGLYMVGSFVCQMPWALGAIILGKGMFNGNLKVVIYGLGLIVVAGLIIQQVRKRYGPKPS
jgi:uncharacterized membrane protein YdjX (TVP38/TMEM64 family)